MSKSNRDRVIKWDRRQARMAKGDRAEVEAALEYQRAQPVTQPERKTK